MAFEDYLEPEVGIAVAVTAAVASPRVRNVLRRGAVYGLAGVLMAGDAVTSLARGVQRGARNAVSAAEDTVAGEGDAPKIIVPPGVNAESSDASDATDAAPKRSRKASPEASSHE